MITVFATLQLMYEDKF